MMGEFPAEFPTDRLYAKNHMWAQRAVADGNNKGEQKTLWRFGFAAYAIRLLQDVYFLDWTIDQGAVLTEKQEIGAIESSKAEASLYSPIAGELVELNDTLLGDPSGVNVDKYGVGWLFTLRGAGSELLDPQGYQDHLAAVWEVTQRTIKGQMNE